MTILRLFFPLFMAVTANVSAQLVTPADPVLLEKHQPHPQAAGDVPLDWKTGEGGSYVIPTFEVPGFLATLSLYDRIAMPHDVYDSTLQSTWEHVHEQHWVFDTDPFNINQLGHPYQGATMFGLARSTGVGFWQALIYSNAGSMVWKMAGETDLPSINDQITTGTAGALFGEALFRLSSLFLESGGKHPGFWHELGAAAISPPTGLNRLLFGQRFDAVFPSYDPAIFFRLRLGVSFPSTVTSNAGTSTPPAKQAAVADYTLVYGLPGKDGYEYKRPFDYFSFEAAGKVGAQSHNYVEDVMIRGMLYGREIEFSDNHRGIAGVYGSYDYIAPEVFRVSSTALSLGSTDQWWLSNAVALQGTAMVGVGFAGAGNTPQADGLRDYHYGATPQGLFALRTIFGHRAMFDLTARDYYVSGTGSDDKRGSEQIFRADAGITVRLFGHQAVGVEFLASDRRAHYVHLPNRHETEGKFSVVYSLLGDRHFGAVDWRPDAQLATAELPAPAELQGIRPDRLWSGAYAHLVWQDTLAVVTAPLRWDGGDWLKAGGALGAVAVTVPFDNSIRDRVQASRSPAQDHFFAQWQNLGSYYSFVVLGGFEAWGELGDNMRARNVAMDGLTASIIAAGFIAPVAKFAVGRERPVDNQGAFKFHPFTRNVSFPSGHATQAFAIATVISEHYPDWWVGTLAYGSAALVGYARIEQDAHFTSDVVAGAIIGWSVAKSVVRRHSQAPDPRKLSWSPYARGDGGGLIFYRSF